MNFPRNLGGRRRSEAADCALRPIEPFLFSYSAVPLGTRLRTHSNLAENWRQSIGAASPGKPPRPTATHCFCRFPLYFRDADRITEAGADRGNATADGGSRTGGRTQRQSRSIGRVGPHGKTFGHSLTTDGDNDVTMLGLHRCADVFRPEAATNDNRRKHRPTVAAFRRRPIRPKALTLFRQRLLSSGDVRHGCRHSTRTKKRFDVRIAFAALVATAPRAAPTPFRPARRQAIMAKWEGERFCRSRRGRCRATGCSAVFPRRPRLGLPR